MAVQLVKFMHYTDAFQEFAMQGINLNDTVADIKQRVKLHLNLQFGIEYITLYYPFPVVLENNTLFGALNYVAGRHIFVEIRGPSPSPNVSPLSSSGGSDNDGSSMEGLENNGENGRGKNGRGENGSGALLQGPNHQINAVGYVAHLGFFEPGRRAQIGPDMRAQKILIIASVLCLSFLVAEVIEVLGALVSVLLIWVITGILVYIAVERIINKTYDVDGEIMLIAASVGVGVNLIMGFILHRGGALGHSHGCHSHGAHSHQRSGDHDRKGHRSRLEKPNQNHHRREELPEGTVIVVGGSLSLDSESGESSHGGHRITPVNINVRVAFIQVIGNFLQSLGSLIAALIIFFKSHLVITDPICTYTFSVYIFSVLVLLTTLAITRDALNVVMGGLPRGIAFTEVPQSLLGLDGVERVDDLRIWSLTMDKTALAVHLAVDSKHDSHQVLNNVTELRVLRQRISVFKFAV